MKKLVTLLCFFIIFFSTEIYCQKAEVSNENAELIEQLKNKPKQGFFGLAFTTSVPQNEFFDNLGKSGLGFSVYGGWSPSSIPIAIGLEGDFLFYGADTKYYSWYHKGFRYTDTIETQNFMLPINAFFRLQPNVMNFIYPYLEGGIGFTVFNAHASYTPAGSDYDEVSNNETNVAFQYSGAVGAMIKLVDFVNVPSTSFQMLLDIKAKYIKGGKTDYHDVKLDNNAEPVFTKYRSNTDLIVCTFGIAFRF